LPRDDVSPLLKAADLFVFPSRREGLPNAVLEALGIGLPCILSDIEPLREIAATNAEAKIRFIPTDDVASLVVALREASREIGEKLSSGVSQSAGLGSTYRLENVAHRYLELYRELIDAYC
jgi:glycosyltransferase involved in cell wall biosynthesis